MNTFIGNRLALLLSDPSPCLRLMVLRELMDLPNDDAEVMELLGTRETDPLAVSLFRSQKANGSWEADGQLWQGNRLRATSMALARLGYLGFNQTHPTIRQGIDYLFSLQQADGGWPRSNADGMDEGEGYVMIPLQTSLPLRAIALCGYAADPRAEKAYEWLLARRLEDGAWPTGIAGGTEASGVGGRVGGYRRLAHSNWGCRTNTTAALLCLAHHPNRRHGQEAWQALDLLLGRETREMKTVGFEISRLLGAEPTRGYLTFFARFDPGLLLDLCRRTGASPEDTRVANLVLFIRDALGGTGLWNYLAQPQISRWVTFDLLRSLKGIQTDGSWNGMEPQTPFQSYPTRRYRF